MDLGLAERVVLVTGGSDGLGRALCSTLVGEGARVALCGRDAARVEGVAQELRAAGGDAVGVVADVTVPAALETLVAAALERWGRIDGLVNNAGHAAARTLVASTDAEWQADLDLKVLAAVRLCRLVLPHLAAGGGSIVNVLAIAAKAPGAGSSPSSVSRAAGLALTKALSREVAPDGVRVNAVLIGYVESGQWTRAASARGVGVDDLYRSIAEDAGIPLGRVGRAEEFADVVAFLLSTRASYVTGTALNIDGGLCAVT